MSATDPAVNKSVAVVQLYCVSPLLDVAVPVTTSQTQVKLIDGALVPVTPKDLLAVFYNAKGVAVGSVLDCTYISSLGDLDTISFTRMCRLRNFVPGPVLNRHGVAWFVQHFYLHSHENVLVPILADQTAIVQSDGPALPIEPESCLLVFFAEKSLAVFYRRPDKTVMQGVPEYSGLVYSAVPHQSIPANSRKPTVCRPFDPLSPTDDYLSDSDGNSVVCSLSTAHIVLYGADGRPDCMRLPNGSLVTASLHAPGAVKRLRFLFAPEDQPDILWLIPRLAPEIAVSEDEMDSWFSDDLAVVLEGSNEVELCVWASGRDRLLEEGSLLEIMRERLVTSGYLQCVGDGGMLRARLLTGKLRDRAWERVLAAEEISERSKHRSKGASSSSLSSFASRTDKSNKIDKGNNSNLRSSYTRPSPIKQDTYSQPPSSRFSTSRQSLRRGSDSSAQTFNDIDKMSRRDSRASSSTANMNRWKDYEATETDTTSNANRRRSNTAFMSDDNVSRPNEGRSSLSKRRPSDVNINIIAPPAEIDENEVEEENNTRKVSLTDVALTQRYFLLDNINYAIPIAPGQSYVKLADGTKKAVIEQSVYLVDYDMRGLPKQTNHMGNFCHTWAMNKPGVAFKFQNYFVHEALQYAVPVVPCQTSVTVSDGSSLPVKQENIISVFYDVNGNVAFNFAGDGKGKIKPLGPGKAGVAESISLMALFPSANPSGPPHGVMLSSCSQNYCHIAALGSGVQQVDRSQLAVLFFEDQEVKYSQDERGFLMSGELDRNILMETGPGQPGASRKATGANDIPSEYRLTSSGEYEKVIYVEIPEEIEVVTKVPVRRTEIIERRIPKVEVEYVEKLVEVPEIVYIDKTVEVEKIEYTTKFVKKKEIVDKPVEQIRYIPKIETRIIEKRVEVPQIVEVPRAEIIERIVHIDKFQDKNNVAVVAQTVNPVVKQSLDQTEDVECLTLEPKLVAVDVYVPKLVRSSLRPSGGGALDQTPVKVSSAHFNSLLLHMNPHFTINFEKLPLIKAESGSIPMMPSDSQLLAPEPTMAFVRSILPGLIKEGN